MLWTSDDQGNDDKNINNYNNFLVMVLSTMVMMEFKSPVVDVLSFLGNEIVVEVEVS